MTGFRAKSLFRNGLAAKQSFTITSLLILKSFYFYERIIYLNILLRYLIVRTLGFVVDKVN